MMRKTLLIPALCLAGTLSFGDAIPPPPVSFVARSGDQGPAAFAGRIREAEREKLETRQLAVDYVRETAPAKKEILKKRLRDIVTKNCEREIAKDRETAEILQAQLRRTTERLDKRVKNKDAMIELKISELIADPDLRW